MNTLPIVVYVVPVVLILFAVPLILQKVPRNWFYGFRTPTTLANDAVWYAANKVAGRDMLMVGCVLLALLAAAPLLPWISPTVMIGVVQPAVLAVGIAHSFYALRKM